MKMSTEGYLEENLRSFEELERDLPHRFKCTLHEPPEEFEAYLMGRKAVPPAQTKRVQSKRHNRRKSNVKFLLLETLGPEVAIVHWRCDITPLTSCEMIMKFTISREAGGEDGGGIRRIEVEGLQEADLSEEALDKIPQSTAAMKTTRLSVEYGTIFLRPLRFGQTDFCYFAEVGIEEGYDDNRMSGSSRMMSSSKLIKSMTTSLSSGMNQSGNKVMSMISSISSGLSGRSGSGLSLTDKRNRNKAGRMFKRLDEVFYRRFEREDVIDQRMTLDFIENLANAPPKSEAEQTQITKSLNLVQEHSVATRLSGTDNDPVEKFYHRVGEGGSGWLLSVANIDVAAKILFAQLWLIDLYAKRHENKASKVRRIWQGLDGTRGLQYTRSLNMPGGFQSRLFQVWITWDEIVEADGRKTYVIAISPIQEYRGTRHSIETGKMVCADSRGVYVIKEVTENTCEWTWVQNVNLKISVLPANAMDFIAKQQLFWADEVHEQHRRNDSEVDMEYVQGLLNDMKSSRGRPLMDDQVPLLQRCKELLGTTEWKSLESPDPDVKMMMQYQPPKKGERSIITGKATCEVDCSAEEVAAWAYNFKSRIDMRKQSDSVQTRIEVRDKRRANERTFALIKKLPFPLSSREFVFRILWKVEDSGEVLVAIESVLDEDHVTVKYGTSHKVVKASVRGLWRLKNLSSRGGASRCEVEFYQRIDAGGVVPTWLVNRKVPEGLSSVQTAVNTFRQDEKIDTAERDDLMSSMQQGLEAETYTEEEEAWIKAISEKYEKSSNGGERIEGFKKLISPDPYVKMESMIERGSLNMADKSTAGCARAIAIIDASLEECAAHDFIKTSREKVKGGKAGGTLEKHIIELNSHSHIYQTINDLQIPSFAPREWVARCMWKVVDDKTIITGVADTEHEAFPMNGPRRRKYVRASASAFFRYERLPDVGGIPQTRVTYYQTADLRGLIPKWIMRSKIVWTLTSIVKMRAKFDRSSEIDGVLREKFQQKVEDEEACDEETRNEALRTFYDIFEEKKGCERPSNSFGMADSKVQADPIGGHVWGRTSVPVRAPVTEVAAFLMHFGSRANMHLSGDIERTYEAEDTDDGENHGLKNSIVKRRQRYENVHRLRVFTSEMTLHTTDNAEATFIILVKPHRNEDQRKSHRARRTVTIAARGSILTERMESVEARETVAIRLRSSGQFNTKMDYACMLELGAAGSRALNKAFVERRLDEVSSVATYFLRLLQPDQLNERDGEAISYDLLWKTSTSKQRAERMKELMKENRALRNLVEKYSWVPTMMVAASKGELHMIHTVRTKAECVSEKEAAQIGNSLSAALMTEQLMEAGVRLWIMENRPLRKISSELIWFEPFIVVLGKGIVKTAAWGLMWRVILGTFLSMGDLITDILVLKEFWEGGEEMLTYRNLSIVGLVMSMALQIFVVTFNYRRLGARRVAREIAIVLFGFKPPWDAYKVGLGRKVEQGVEWDPIMEMTFSKVIEMFTESIPSVMIQSSAILDSMKSGHGISKVAMFSLAISTLTTGFVSATISYDFDTNPSNRVSRSEFYGYVNDSPMARASAFALLTLMSSCQVFLRSTLIVMLALISSNLVWIWIVGDMSLFLLLKVLRGDFTYWIRMSGAASIIISLIVRVIAKATTDFTGCVQMRHPQELGGIYFSVNYFIPLVGLIVILTLKDESTFENETIDAYLQSIVYIVGLFLLTSVAFFVVVIRRGYIGTFFSRETGGASMRRIFLTGDDVARSQIISVNEVFMKPIHDHVERWIATGWETWQDEKPVWFTDQWKSLVPVYMIPVKERTPKSIRRRIASGRVQRAGGVVGVVGGGGSSSGGGEGEGVNNTADKVSEAGLGNELGLGNEQSAITDINEEDKNEENEEEAEIAVQEPSPNQQGLQRRKSLLETFEQALVKTTKQGKDKQVRPPKRRSSTFLLSTGGSSGGNSGEGNRAPSRRRSLLETLGGGLAIGTNKVMPEDYDEVDDKGDTKGIGITEFEAEMKRRGSIVF